ncbi:MAG: metallophosphoesterase [Bradyrhizobium sp.]|uniref:metallophosphoesterase n=1 Tax=Bradyrhizobium sp. TaxID=376 RepID=UPI00272FC80E|nr:metallophosphoesterase [Bradyrhizobium sp.]MDP1865407.1 metallophosphoesterase [Bradyrhizobium sp.]
MRVIVISDLHMGCGPLEDFDPEVEQGLIEFCNQIAAEEELTELVINGDFLDFVQAEPWQSPEFESETPNGISLCFTEQQSLQKLENILRAHSGTFDALAGLVNSKTLLRLTIMPGNHDPDIFWRKVRTRLHERLSPGVASDKVRFHLEPQYQPPEFPRLWIEHGHQHDACNSFKIKDTPCWSTACPPFLADKENVDRLIECVGTRFLLKFMNAMDEKYPFVDNVKPFSKFVKMFLVSSVSRDFGPIKALVSYWALASFMAGRLAKAPSELLSTEESPDKMADEMIRLINDLSDDKAEKLKTRLVAAGFQIGSRQLKFFVKQDTENAEKLLDFLSEHPDVMAEIETDQSGLLSPGDRGYLTLGGGFIADETRELKNAARKIIDGGFADAVVMGHTHEPVNTNSDLNYVNTGSWIRYFKEVAGNQRSSWSMLKQSGYPNFPYELAYAEIGEKTNGKLMRRIFRPQG